MSIEGIKLNQMTLNSIRGVTSDSAKTQGTQASGKTVQSGAKSFGDMFSEAIKDVDQMQLEADRQIEGLTMGKDGITTHDAMIALEKADIAFQLMNTIRGKIVRAYEEVLRTQI